MIELLKLFLAQRNWWICRLMLCWRIYSLLVLVLLSLKISTFSLSPENPIYRFSMNLPTYILGVSMVTTVITPHSFSSTWCPWIIVVLSWLRVVSSHQDQAFCWWCTRQSFRQHNFLTVFFSTYFSKGFINCWEWNSTQNTSSDFIKISV